MTKKKTRIRYSELAPERTPVPTAAPAPEPAQAVEAPKPKRKPRKKAAVAEAPAPEVPAVVEEALAHGLARPRRNSSPVELAHALAAARAAEEAAAAEADSAVADAIDPTTLAGANRGSLRSRAQVEELLMFRVGEERFAVELLAVEEVIDLPVIHHVPEMPPAMLGVVTVRGFLTPVYSPHTALGLPLLTKEAVLIFRRGRARVGILIDDVEDAVEVDLGDLRSAPTEQEIDNVVLGVVRHAGVLVAIVDADALIAACQAATILEIA